MINDQIRGANWVNLVRVSVQLQHSITHGGKVYDGWDTREVLENDAGGFEGHLDVLIVSLLTLDGLPVQDVGHILLSYLEVVAVPYCGLQQDTDREGELIWRRGKEL